MTEKQRDPATIEEAEAAVRTLLSWIGEDPKRSGLRRTPMRVLKSFDDWFSGYGMDPAEVLGSSFPDAEDYRHVVALTDIDFVSHCEHHMAPFIGRAHIAYVPDERVVGVSKLVRVVEAFSRRLQVQEKLTMQVANCINDVLKPKGVAVVIEAKHQCMTTRGVNQKGIRMVTNAMHGSFETDAKIRDEFLAMIGNPALNR